MNRRGFSGLLGGLFAASSIPMGAVVPPLSGPVGGAFTAGAAGLGIKDRLAKQISRLTGQAAHVRGMKLLGHLPSVVAEEIWREACVGRPGDVYGAKIRADIACLKSASNAGKRWMSQQRDYNEMVKEWYDSPTKALKEAIFYRDNKDIKRWYNYNQPHYEED